MKAQVKLWNSHSPHFHTLVSSKSIFAKGKEKHNSEGVCITFQLLRFLFCKLNICDGRKNQKGMYSCLAFVAISVLAVSPLMIPLSISRAWSKVSGKDFSLALLILYWYWYNSVVFSVYYNHLSCQSCPCCTTSGRWHHSCVLFPDLFLGTAS